jgi:hypothetical protein
LTLAFAWLFPVTHAARAATSTGGSAVAADGPISGMVTAGPGGVPIAGADVSIFDAGGGLVTAATADAGGTYGTGTIPSGVYFALASSSGFADQLHDGIACAGACVTTAGTPIHLNPSQSVVGIDFALQPAGGISGTVTRATLAVARASDDWETLEIDLSPFAGQAIRLRFMVTGSRPGHEPRSYWRIARND